MPAVKTLGLSLLLAIATSAPVFAYVGPGAGAGAVGVVLGIIASVFIAFFAIVWYPVKRLLRKRKARKEAAEAQKIEEPNQE